jgi:hypothetical protein
VKVADRANESLVEFKETQARLSLGPIVEHLLMQAGKTF